MGLFATLWNLRAEMKRVGLPSEAGMWRRSAKLLGDKNVIGLTRITARALPTGAGRIPHPGPPIGDLVYHADLRRAENDFEQNFFLVCLEEGIVPCDRLDELNRSYS